MRGGEHWGFGRRAGFSDAGAGDVFPSCRDDGHPWVDPDIEFLLGFGIARHAAEQASAQAAISGRHPGEELVRAGVLSRSEYLELAAHHLDIDFANHGPDPDRLLSVAGSNAGSADAPIPADPGKLFSRIGHRIAVETKANGTPDRYFLALDPGEIPRLAGLLAVKPSLKKRIVLTTPARLQTSLFEAGRGRYVDRAASGLSRLRPAHSAARTATVAQKVVLLVFLISLIAAFALAMTTTTLLVHALLGAFYLALVMFRVLLCARATPAIVDAERPVPPSRVPDRDLPGYCVLVALRDEAEQVADLVANLAALDWPADRLEILLICEGDDPATIAAVRAADLDERFRLLVCPVAEPRTKPKALNYALPLCSGELLVLYDAEDRPHPGQLKEAFNKFARESDLAVLQAPLYVHNTHQGWLCRMFAIEYVTQFGSVLPVLERWRSPIPLGGTSNHFRLDVLRRCGGWDPHNVTEDADLGFRFARMGLHCGTLTLATMEEAPPLMSVWLKQRTRWIKGWLQTLLVHTRHPVRAGRELGFRRTVLFHLVLTSLVISVLAHPVFLLTTIYLAAQIARGVTLGFPDMALLATDMFNLIAGYTTYAALVFIAVDDNRYRRLRHLVFTIPIYWILVSVAGWRAVYQLVVEPHLWEKTPHGFSRLPEVSSIARPERATAARDEMLETIHESWGRA